MAGAMRGSNCVRVQHHARHEPRSAARSPDANGAPAGVSMVERRGPLLPAREPAMGRRHAAGAGGRGERLGCAVLGAGRHGRSLPAFRGRRARDQRQEGGRHPLGSGHRRRCLDPLRTRTPGAGTAAVSGVATGKWAGRLDVRPGHSRGRVRRHGSQALAQQKVHGHGPPAGGDDPHHPRRRPRGDSRMSRRAGMSVRSRSRRSGGTMRKLTWLFASLLLSAGSGIAGAQGAASGKPAAKPTTVAQIEDYLVAAVGRGFVRTADAMPAYKYSFAPTHGNFKGVRTLAEQVKHVAAANYQMGGALLKEKHPVEFASGGGPDSITTKAEILKFLTGSFELLRKAGGTLHEKTPAPP